MSTLELNKIVGACLTAGVIAMIAFVVPKLYFGGHGAKHDVSAYASHGEAGKEAKENATEAAAEPAEAPVPVAEALAKANAENGAKIFKKCGACHTIDQGGKARVGPNLWGVVGRDVASFPGFAYSEALSGKGGKWDFASLYVFLNDPKTYAPGTKMSFAGLKKSSERADLLAYVNSQGDSPQALPKE
jgi:cytochrome c